MEALHTKGCARIQSTIFRSRRFPPSLPPPHFPLFRNSDFHRVLVVVKLGCRVCIVRAIKCGQSNSESQAGALQLSTSWTRPIFVTSLLSRVDGTHDDAVFKPSGLTFTREIAQRASKQLRRIWLGRAQSACTIGGARNRKASRPMYVVGGCI